jgi:hypothetical protein
MIPQTPEHPEATRRDVYYSVGVSATGNLKERIAELHGNESLAATVVAELDRFVSTPEYRQTRWYRAFCRKVYSSMSILYPHANAPATVRMAQEYIDDLVHGGYLRVLQSLAMPSGRKHVSFAQEFADSHGVSLSEVLLFGPRGGAVAELLHFIATEKAHGVHRPSIYQKRYLSAETQKCWHNAQKANTWPTVVDAQGEEAPLDPSDERSYLSEEVIDKLQSLWRRNPALRDYTGARRLSGDTPYQIVEDAVDVVIQKGSSPMNNDEKARYTQIVEEANRQGIDPFYAAYQALPAGILQTSWNQAKQWLYDYSLALWETQNQLWLIEGKRSAAGGVVYRPTKATAPEPKNKAVPGTIYLNNGRYWWVVARKMKPRPLIDPKSKRKVPGTIFQQGGRYYWVISGVLGRQRLVPKGETFSTQDRATAEKIAHQKWQQLQKEDPSLAAYILSRRQAQGLATQDRALAQKIAARLWRQIRRDDPELAAQILTHRRPQAQDHWYAHIGSGATQRYIGSFTSRAEARSAYAREFEATYGYPPGYNVQCLPKLDKVWPSWMEEEARLRRMAERPRMPVICQSCDAEPLTPLVQKMQKVDWLVGHVVVVFDDDSPVASPDIAIQSRGTAWYEQARVQGKHLVICGCAYVDPESRRIRITLYKPGFGTRQVLLEEIYHIGLKILFYGNPGLFATIRRWHRRQLAEGCDATFALADRFASMMALEETGVRTTLPSRVVTSARKLLSPSSHIPASIMHTLITHWSQPLPV